MNTYKTLLRFTNPNEEFNEFMRRPFLYELDGKNVAVATDGIVLCIAKDGCPNVGELTSTRKPNIERVIPPEKCDSLLSLKDVYEALAKVPMVHDNECPECGGEGQVRYEYYCESDYTTDYKTFDCPYCSGRGLVEDSQAPLVYDTAYAVSINNQTFYPKSIKRLADILTGLELTYVPYCVNVAMHLMKIETEQYIILLSGCIDNGKTIIL